MNKKSKETVSPVKNDVVIKTISELRLRCAWLTTLPDKQYINDRLKLIQLLFELPVFDEAIIYLRRISENFENYRKDLDTAIDPADGRLDSTKTENKDVLQNIEQFLLDSSLDVSTTLFSFNVLRDFYVSLYDSELVSPYIAKLKKDFDGNLKAGFSYSLNSILNFLFDYYVNDINFNLLFADKMILNITKQSLEAGAITYENNTLKFGNFGSIKFSPEKSATKDSQRGIYVTGVLFEKWQSKKFNPLHSFEVKDFMNAQDLRAIIDKLNKRSTILYKSGSLKAHIQVVPTAKDSSGYKGYKFEI